MICDMKNIIFFIINKNLSEGELRQYNKRNEE